MLNFFSSIQYRLEYTFLRFFLIFAENLPIHMSYAIAHAIGTIVWFLSRKRRQRIKENLEIAYPDGIPFPVKEFTRKVFVHSLYIFFELALAKRLLHKYNWQDYVTGDDLEILQKKIFSQYPASIFCSGHLGNFAILGHIVSYAGVPILTVIRELYNPFINALFIKILNNSFVLLCTS